VISKPLALSTFAALTVLLIASSPSVCSAATVPSSQPKQAHAELLLVAAPASQPEVFVLVHDGEQAADEDHKTQALPQVAAPVAPVPELDTWALMLGGLGALGFITRRRLFG
jgi:hypothetical protein